MDRLRVGVIGCGAIGNAHFDAYRQLLDTVDVVALCDIKEEAVTAAGQIWPGARTETNYRDMLESGDLDLVSVCTMPNTHCEITVAALEAGAHVLCEKPFAMNLAEADRMLEMSESVGRFLQVGTNMRHMTAAGILRDLVESGKLGKPTYIRAWMFSCDIPWWGPHFVKESSGGGALAADAIHILDVALWVAGSPDPIAVTGSTHRMFPAKRAETAPSPEKRDSYDVEDIAAAHIRLSNGGTLMLESTWAHERLADDYSFEMICERGTICLTPLSILMDEEGKIVDRTPADFPNEPHAWGKSVCTEIARFSAAIREGREPSQTLREIRNLQLIQDSIYESARIGREIRLDAS